MLGSKGCQLSCHCRLEPGAYCNLLLICWLQVHRHAGGEDVEHLLPRIQRWGCPSVPSLVWNLSAGRSEPSWGKFPSPFGWPSSRRVPYNHSYIPYRWLGTLILPSGSLLLGWVRPLLTDEPLQLSLSDKGFNLLLQVVTVGRVMAVVTVELAILISRSLIRVFL